MLFASCLNVVPNGELMILLLQLGHNHHPTIHTMLATFGCQPAIVIKFITELMTVSVVASPPFEAVFCMVMPVTKALTDHPVFTYVTYRLVER